MALSDVDSSQLALMRLFRLTRLTRLIRIFKLRQLKELHLMAKGLIAGMKTLLWAFVLLTLFLYVLAVLMTMLMRPDVRRRGDPEFEDEIEGHFSTLFRSFFTLYRVFLGDTATSQGKSMIHMLFDALGQPFALGYIGCTMLVTFGIFNLIMAVYIEQTLCAAKNEEVEEKVRRRETLRIARNMKLLVQKFCTAQRASDEGLIVNKTLSATFSGDTSDIMISKATFIDVLQDSAVQKVMDDLHMPAERTRLFDILDADGSGSLAVRELVNGLLKVRGEPQRSDIIANFLATRALFDRVLEVEDVVLTIRNSLAELARSPGKARRTKSSSCRRSMS